MKTGKRIVSIFLVVLMLLTAAPLAGFVGLEIAPQVKALAETGQCGEDVYWNFNMSTGSLTISGFGEMANYNHTWPFTESPFLENNAIKSVIINSGVTSIGEYAFDKCSGLTSVTIPNSVTSIGRHAFNECSSLTKVTIPDSVTSIGDWTFAICSSLSSVTISGSVMSIDDYTFAYCKNLTSVTIPDSVTSIGVRAFSGCTKLTNIAISDSVTSIGDNAFCECSSLTSILVDENNRYYSSDENGCLYNRNKTELIQYPIGNIRTSFSIPNSVTHISDNTFWGCSNLTSLTIPNSVTSIGDGAFVNCSSLTSITIPDGVTKIGFQTFHSCSGMTSVSIPNSVTIIEDRAFSACQSLTSVQIPASVTRLGEEAFSASGLETVIIPNNVTNVGNRAFAGCYNLTNATIGNGVTRISENAFISCIRLSNVTISEGVKSIDEFVFDGCGSLKSVTIPSTVTNIGDSAFCGCYYLEDIYYNGTEAMWNKIVIGPNNDYYLNEATIHYTGGGGEEPPIEVPVEGISLNTDQLVLTMGTCESLIATITPANATNKSITWSSGDPTVATVDGNGLIVTKREGITTILAEARDGDAFLFDSCKVIVRGPAYSLGEETYSFKNFHGKYTDQYGYVHANQCYDPKCTEGGHCFGMSMTSAGYYLGTLNKSLIGSSNDNPLFTFSFTDAVKKPIHYYQVRQGENRDKSMVAGGTAYKTWKINPSTGKSEHTNDIIKDWDEVVNYVNNHSFDNKGNLQIGFRKDGEGGHAINFLRYSVVNGQKRIYAYDNNFPTEETYLYKGSDGKVYQAPEQTFSGAIDCVALRDVNKYYSVVDGFDLSRVIYAGADEIMIENADVYAMECGPEVGEYCMYELPDDITQVRIVPLVDDAEFTYMDQTYSFGAIDDDTYGVLTLAADETGTGTLTVENAPSDDPSTHTHTYTSTVTTPATCTEPGIMTYTCVDGDDTYTETIPATGHTDDNNDGRCDACGEQMTGGDHCKFCGKIHNGGFFDKLTGFFHKIFAIFKR